MMGIKERLDRARESAKERRSILWNLERLKREIDTIRDAGHMILSASTIKAQGETSNPTQDKAIKIVDKYSERLDEMYEDLGNIDYKIGLVRRDIKIAFKKGTINSNEKNVLIYFYIEGMSLDEIVVAMNYSLRHIQDIKADALKNMKTNEYLV